MTTIVNNDPLVLILTDYGLNRIAEALADNTVTLNLSKIKVGNGENEEYYTPSADQTELKGPVENGSFYIIEKELLEDGITTCLKALFPENFGGCDIREVGLYETTTNNEDKLFAIATQQPIVKPNPEDNYFMAVDYLLFLKSANLAEVYDQIILNPDNQLISEKDLQELMNSMLFTQGNLSVQIGKNSRIIGLNRASQLYEQIVANRDAMGNTAVTGSFATLSGFTGSDNIIGYWMFDYPRRNTAAYSITDLNLTEYNMSSSSNVNSLERNYHGIVPFLTFKDSDYYFLNAETPFSLYNIDLEEDYSFTMMFTVAPVNTSSTRTLLAKSNYATGSHVFEVNELASGAVEVKIFSDKDNYITFTSASNLINPDDVHALVISYDKDEMSLTGYLNGNYLNFTKTMTGNFTHISTGGSLLYGFSFTPYEIIYTDSLSDPTELLNKDGSPYTGEDWVLDEGEFYYKSEQANRDSNHDLNTDYLYAWTYNDGVYDYFIYTKTLTLDENTKLYNADLSEYTGSDYVIRFIGGEYTIQYQNSYIMSYDSNFDIPSREIYAYITYLPEIHIWANSNSEPVILFDSNGDIYTGSDWTVENYTISYKDQGDASYDSSLNKNITSEGVASYIIDIQGNPVQYVNSEIGIIAATKTALSVNEMRICALELISSLGKNPCMVVNE